MENIIAIAMIAALIIPSSLYVYKAKKRGQRCIGCPYGKECGGKCTK